MVVLELSLERSISVCNNYSFIHVTGVLFTGDSVESEGYIYVLSPPTITSFSLPESIDEGNTLSVECTGSGTPTPNVTIVHQVRL